MHLFVLLLWSAQMINLEIIEEAASESHLIIHRANSGEDLPSAKAIIADLNKRTQTTGKPAIYIHTGGTVSHY